MELILISGILCMGYMAYWIMNDAIKFQESRTDYWYKEYKEMQKIAFKHERQDN